MRICIVYDCLYPHTVGGAERWYRAMAIALAADGHDVTYLTRRQWAPDARPEVPGVRVIAVSPGGPLYTESGRRLVGPPLRFGLGVFRHLARNRRRYDAVHLCAFPYFSLIATRVALVGRATAIGVDWFEVWTRDYWRTYLGRAGGSIGFAVQRLCVRLTPKAFVFSDRHGVRLRDEGLRGRPVRLAGLFEGTSSPRPRLEPPDPPSVVFAGRHIPEKGVPRIPPAIAAARRSLPTLRCVILGDGPERGRLMTAVAEAGLEAVVSVPGFVDAADVESALAGATCLLLPSVREGYGLVVIEAAAAGTPSVVVDGPDNAAVELIVDGVNGFVAASDAPADLAASIEMAHAGGRELRLRTVAWFREHAHQLSLEASLDQILVGYAPTARS